jgi:hypothetical protein
MRMKVALKIGSLPINTQNDALDVKLNIPSLFIHVNIRLTTSLINTTINQVLLVAFNKKKCILLLTVILVILLYFFLHLRHCTTIQVLTKDELLNTDFGNNHHTLKNVPDYLLTPASIKRTT